ncbi:MAG: hypothetical protein JSR37_05065 [Verrucomicrobia bacterium]|nr:hypothetical protein [Verrucomicrobiota bacterium]MBS0636004.1 hypothetical protein [Verrucomicrobiota bacterium]
MYKYVSLALLASMMQLSASVAVDGKVYVKPRQVRIMKNKTIVHTQDGTFVTPTVSRDEQGIFVMQQDLQAAPELANKKRCGGGCGKKMWKKKKMWKMKQRQNVDAPAVAAQ